ncbi:hypothetical protein [Clostridium sp.]
MGLIAIFSYIAIIPVVLCFFKSWGINERFMEASDYLEGNLNE